jgi:hypothetical protein
MSVDINAGLVEVTEATSANKLANRQNWVWHDNLASVLVRVGLAREGVTYAK